MPVSPIGWRHYATNDDDFGPIRPLSRGPVHRAIRFPLTDARFNFTPARQAAIEGREIKHYRTTACCGSGLVANGDVKGSARISSYRHDLGSLRYDRMDAPAHLIRMRALTKVIDRPGKVIRDLNFRIAGLRLA